MKNMKIGARLGLGFALVVALLIAVAGIGINRLALVNDASTIIVQDRYAKVNMIHDVQDHLNKIVRSASYATMLAESDQVKRELDRMANSRGCYELKRLQAVNNLHDYPQALSQ